MVYVSILKDKVFRIFVYLSISIIFYPVVVHSAVFNVTNEDELRQALSIAESNGEDDIVNIAAGLYETFGAPFGYSSAQNFALTIQGAGAGFTILDAGESDRVLEINTVSESDIVITIKSLTIQNGFPVTMGGGGSANPNGGGILAFSQNISIEDCEFINNIVSLDGNGGGLSVDAENKINLLGNLFSGNSAGFGGGGGANLSALELNIIGNQFIENSAHSGGGLHASGTMNISSNQFIQNTAAISGGGSYLGSSDPNLSNNEFYSNIAEFGDGGGAYLDSESGVVSCTITNNIFSNNSSSANGGGIAILTCCFMIDYVITNNTFTLNTANENGGGMSFQATLGEVAPPPIEQAFILDIYNNIVFNNFSTGNGDDLFIVENAFPGKNLVVSLFNNDFSDLSVDCVSQFGCTTEINQGNNINQDPLFVDSEAGDFSLLPDSPCIDAGDPNAPDVPDTDIFGNPRVPPPDMGAVEYIEEAIKGGGGCSIAHNPVSSSLAVFLALPVLILIRRIVKRYRS